jgi:hypothetical protein
MYGTNKLDLRERFESNKIEKQSLDVLLLSSLFNTCRVSSRQPKREYRDRKDGSTTTCKVFIR